MSSSQPAWSEQFNDGVLGAAPGLGLGSAPGSGSLVPGSGSGPGPIDREWAWGGATGRGVRVAVIDSGVDADHPRVGGIAGSVAFELDADAEDGYRIVEICEDDDEPLYWLHVERVEAHSVDSLHERNLSFHRLAEKLGLESYDGMDVGLPPPPN